jgi:hypothetical protein
MTGAPLTSARIGILVSPFTPVMVTTAGAESDSDAASINGRRLPIIGGLE